MRLSTSILIVGLCLVPFIAYGQADPGEPRFKLDRAKSRVLELSNLSPDEDCQPGQVHGKVVKRSFGEDGTTVQNFTIEHQNGERSLINIDEIQLDNASMATRSWVLMGLQTLLKEGQSVSVGVRLCGAAGRVVMADSIRPTNRR